MLIELEITGLVESRLRISGTVSSAATGAGLARRLILYNRNRVALAETTSNADGRGSFEVNGNRNDLFVVHAVGMDGECDAVSCPIIGVPV